LLGPCIRSPLAGDRRHGREARSPSAPYVGPGRSLQGISPPRHHGRVVPRLPARHDPHPLRDDGRRGLRPLPHHADDDPRGRRRSFFERSEEHRERFGGLKAPEWKTPPMEIFLRQMMITVEACEEIDLKIALEFLPADHIALASDWPHYDGTPALVSGFHKA